jgi:hypothetical protein
MMGEDLEPVVVAAQVCCCFSFLQLSLMYRSRTAGERSPLVYTMLMQCSTYVQYDHIHDYL